MALLTQGDVVRRTQALLDDPAGARFSKNYLAPYVDQENEDLLIMLELVGVQLEEQIAIFNIPSSVVTTPTDLQSYYASGGPLQYVMRPKWLDWKTQGQPDTSYIPSALVEEIDDVSPGNVGAQEWRWGGGFIQTTPSGTPLTLRLGFDAVTANLYDPTSNVTRGIGNILALQVALFVCSLNNQMGKLGERLEKKVSIAKRNFTSLLVMQGQAKLRVPRGTRRGGAAQISAGGVPYI